MPSLKEILSRSDGEIVKDFVTMKVVDLLPLIKYKKQNGEMGNMFTVAVCDNTTACIAKVYDAEKITSMIVDEVLIIENFYIRDGELAITVRSKVCRTGETITVPDDVMENAKSLLGQKGNADSPSKIIEAATSPKKTVVTVKGVVYKVNDLETKTIRATGEEVAFRHIKIKDDTSKISVILWRDLAKEPIHLKDVIQFNNFQVSDTFSKQRQAIPSVTNKLSSSNLQHLPSDTVDIPSDEDYSSDEDKTPTGVIIGIADLKRYRCCVNDRCYKRKLKDDRCSSCGVFYKNQSSGEAFIAQLLMKCTESATNKTYTVFTQQLEQLTTATNVSLKSKSLETDIAKKFPTTVKYQSLNEKLTKIAVQK